MHKHPTSQIRRTIYHHSESAQEVKACCVHRNDELPPCMIIGNSSASREQRQSNHMVVRANQEAAFEPIKSCLEGKPHVFES